MVLPVTQRIKKYTKLLKKYSTFNVRTSEFIGSVRIIKIRQHENLCYEVDIEVKGNYRFRYLVQYVPYDQIRKNGQIRRVYSSLRRMLKHDINTQLMFICNVNIIVMWDIKKVKWT
jgi:hypothetical protein